MHLSYKSSLRLSIAVILLAVLVIATETYYCVRSHREYRAFSESCFASFQFWESSQSRIREIEKAKEDFLRTREEKYAEQAQTSLKGLHSGIEDWETGEIRERLLALTRQYEQLLSLMVGNVKRRRITQGRRISLQLSDLAEKMHQTIGEFIQRRQTELLLRTQTVQHLTDKAAKAIFGASILIGLTALFAIVSFIRQITNPLQKIDEVLQKSLDGNLTQRTKLQPINEIGKTGQRLDKLLAQLKTFDQLKVEKIAVEKEKLEAVLNLVPEGVIIVDSEGKINLMNNICLQFFGLSLDMVLEKPLSEVALIDKQIKDMVEETLAERKKITDREMEVLVKREKSVKKTLLVNTALVRRLDGEISYIILLFKEMPDREKGREGLKEKIKHALGGKRDESER